MNCKRLVFNCSPVGCTLGTVLLVTLTGCVAYVDRPPQGSVYVAPGVMEDDYVYYPEYEVYYSNSRHQYAYREGNAWVSRSAPRGVSVGMLQASTSVRMDFHDSPAYHHAAVVKQYPKNWRPAGSNQGQNRKDDGHDDNHGK